MTRVSALPVVFPLVAHEANISATAPMGWTVGLLRPLRLNEILKVWRRYR
jgi:hypothetical protein